MEMKEVFNRCLAPKGFTEYRENDEGEIFSFVSPKGKKWFGSYEIDLKTIALSEDREFSRPVHIAEDEQDVADFVLI